MRLEQTRDARTDLLEIFEFGSANFGIEDALAYLDEIERCMHSLLDYPEKGRAEDQLATGVRSLSWRSHRIYYRHLDEAVTIIRILHKSRDAQAWLHSR